MAKFLYEVQEKNRLNQKGVLKRFSINCYGRQETIEDMRAEKTVMFNKLKSDRSSKEYEEWFLKYRPDGAANPDNPEHSTVSHSTKKKKSNKSSKTKRKNKSSKSSKNTRNHKKQTSDKKTRKDRVGKYLKSLMWKKK